MALTNRASQAVEELIIARQFFSSKRPGPSTVRTMSRWANKSESEITEALSGDSIRLCRALRGAEPFWWEPRIVDVIEAAAACLPDWTLREELFPVENAFFWFARALPLPTVQFSPHLVVTGRLRGILWRLAANGASIDYLLDVGPVFNSPLTWVPVYQLEARFGTMYGESDHQLPSSMEMDESDQQTLGRANNYLGAALLFLEQRVATSEVERVDRITRRRLEKANISYPELRVIRLRTAKSNGSTTSESHIDWQSRWLVRGHWRQQYYSSDQSHRPIWVAPYVKGPDDKPLKTPKASVFAVVR